MASPEVARLGRQVREQDETVRAVSDTVLDIKEVVDQHTERLATIQQTQTQHGELLMQHGELLMQHGELLAEILRRLSNSHPLAETTHVVRRRLRLTKLTVRAPESVVGV